jgi:hypothetical protein
MLPPPGFVYTEIPHTAYEAFTSRQPAAAAGEAQWCNVRVHLRLSATHTRVVEFLGSP